MSKNENIYLKRYAYPTIHLSSKPSVALNIVVVIPVYDEPHLLYTLNSLKLCTPPPCDVEVIVVINHEETAPQSVINNNEKTKNDVLAWAKEQNMASLTFHVIYKPELPKKHAGVGMARKIGMDEAVRRLESVGKEKGIIICLDGDCTVDGNYFEAIYEHWQRHPDCNGVSIYYEHPIENIDTPPQGIIDYELHLRYYVNVQRYAGFPFAFQTVGSSMAVTSTVYQKQGGMNKRKAGEDFYFLQKIFQQGHFYDLNTTKVNPSPRPSYRVPFGTGRFINDFINRKEKALTTTYHFNTFMDLKILLGNINEFYYKLPDEVKGLTDRIENFLEAHDFYYDLEKIKLNCASQTTFRKAFFQWFDGFKLMKFVHFYRDNYFPDGEVGVQTDALIQSHFGEQAVFTDNRQRLLYLRDKDRNTPDKLTFW